MREFTTSLFSYTLALSLFGLKQTQNLVLPGKVEDVGGPATEAFESLTNATLDHFGGTLTSFFRTLDNVQRGVIALTFSTLLPFASGRSGASARPGNARETVVPDAAEDHVRRHELELFEVHDRKS